MINENECGIIDLGQVYESEQGNKIWEMNDCDWCAGKDLDGVIETIKEQYDESDPYMWENARQLTAQEVFNLKYYDDYPSTKRGRSFFEELKRREQGDEKFPCFFASTEY